MRTAPSGIVLLLGLLSTTASAVDTTVYRCPGEDGVPVFSDQPCEDAEIITIEDTGNAGLSVWVPDLPPLPEKPKPVEVTPAPVQVVVSPAPPPYAEPVYYPSPYLHSVFRPRRHHHGHDDFHPPLRRPPRGEPPRPPREDTPPPQPRRVTVEIPDKFQRKD